MSELQVNMQLPSSSTKFNTDGRTYVRTKKLVTEVESLSVVDARRGYDGMATLSEILDQDILRDPVRHEVIRTGERESISPHVRSAVWWRDRGQCETCRNGEKADPWELDHITPWSAGGSDDTTNLRVLCQRHNQERSNYEDPTERPRRAATWWCLNCYSEEWDAVAGMPICPTHGARFNWSLRGEQVGSRCRVMSGYLRMREMDGEFPTWHQRPRIVEAHTIAYCAHCNAPALTDRPL